MELPIHTFVCLFVCLREKINMMLRFTKATTYEILCLSVHWNIKPAPTKVSLSCDLATPSVSLIGHRAAHKPKHMKPKLSFAL